MRALLTNACTVRAIGGRSVRIGRCVAMIEFVARVIDELVEDALRELADEAEQRRLWLSSGEHGAEVSSLYRMHIQVVG